MMKPIITIMSACWICSCAAVSVPETSPTHAPTDVTVDFYHGDRVSDPYRWLEEETAKADAWQEKQDAKATKFFTSSNLSGIKEQLVEIEKKKTPSYEHIMWRGNRLFALKLQPPLNQPVLVAMPSWDRPEKEEVLVDPNRIDPTGATAIDWYVPSYNGKTVAVSMSKNDSESGDLYIYNISKTPKGKRAGKRRRKKNPPPPSPSATTNEPFSRIDTVIPGVNRAVGGGSLVWNPDSKSFFYTKYPDDAGEAGLLNQQIFHHKLGRPHQSDTLELGRNFNKIDRVHMEMDERSGRIIATVQKGAADRYAHYLRNPDGSWQTLSTFDDDHVEIVFAPSGGMFVVTRENAKRGKVLHLPSPKVPIARAKRLISETGDVIVAGLLGRRSLAVTKTRLYINYMSLESSEIRVFSLDGRQVDTISLPNAAPGIDLVRMEREDMLIPMHSYAAPNAWYRYNGQLGGGSFTQTRLSTVGDDIGEIRVSEVTAVSKDGAKVPVTLVHKPGLMQNGKNPTLLVGDGGFGNMMRPHFDRIYRVWLDNGGLLAFAKIRGGGELGEGWHMAGQGLYKQHTFDDFHACAKFLVKQKYTNRSKLAVRGKNAGGLLTAVLMTQHPNAIKAVVSESGVYDMLRNEYTAAGEASVPEYGSNADKTQYRAMVAYSPYHHIPKKTDLPAALFIAGKNDRKVAPWHTRKMVARLQAENTASTPIVFKYSSNRGHGNKLPYMQQINESAEILAFLFRALDIPTR